MRIKLKEMSQCRKNSQYKRVYTKEAETADMYIEKITHEIGKKHRVRVATSDNLEQIIILATVRHDFPQMNCYRK